MLTFNIAVVFPGQGSQSVGMLKEYAETWSQVSETFNQASEVLGYDLWDIVSNGPEDKLNQTAITQPAMLAADVSVMLSRVTLIWFVPEIVAFPPREMFENDRLAEGSTPSVVSVTPLLTTRLAIVAV